jgi:hypothetical protein
MSSNKQKRQRRKLTRAEKRAEVERADLIASRREADLKNAALRAALLPEIRKGTVIPVDRSRIVSRSAIPIVPDYYRDSWFSCKDCGERELWTAKQQQRWYEEQGGEIEAVAIRCRACRRKAKLRRETARKIHLEGKARKRNATA